MDSHHVSVAFSALERVELVESLFQGEGTDVEAQEGMEEEVLARTRMRLFKSRLEYHLKYSGSSKRPVFEDCEYETFRYI